MINSLPPDTRLDLRFVYADWPTALGSVASRRTETLAADFPAPVQASDAIRQAVRDALRQAGFKPSGRSKPASEYLRAAVEKLALDPIDAAVDACNGASLHGGLPISVLDLDRVTGALRVAIAAAEDAYVFNRSGQTIGLAGLCCLFDDVGPCGSPVKDSHRTKTTADTRRTVSVVWGSREFPLHTDAVMHWHAALLGDSGAIINVTPR